MEKYYVYLTGMQRGPFSPEELKEKGITKNTQIWFEGLPDWTAAGQIAELKSLFPPTPPAFKTPTEKIATTIGSTLWKLIRLACIIFLCFVGLTIFMRWKSSKDQEDQQKQQIRNNISNYVTVGHSSYNYYAFGGIKNLSIVVTNNSAYLLEHVQVKLNYIKADGGLYKDVILDFDYVPANSQQTLPVPDMDRGTRVTEQILSIRSSALGLK
jgi:GYF domain 2